jgi:hypothetical protein
VKCPGSCGSRVTTGSHVAQLMPGVFFDPTARKLLHGNSEEGDVEAHRNRVFGHEWFQDRHELLKLFSRRLEVKAGLENLGFGGVQVQLPRRVTSSVLGAQPAFRDRLEGRGFLEGERLNGDGVELVESRLHDYVYNIIYLLECDMT